MSGQNLPIQVLNCDTVKVVVKMGIGEELSHKHQC
jgi:hypothetical protein